MHTHLEEGVIRGIQKDADETFAAWSIKKQARVRTFTPEAIKASIGLTIKELLAEGITTVVDNSRLGYSSELLKNESIRSKVISEMHDESISPEQTEISSVLDLLDNSYAGAGPYSIHSLSPESHNQLCEHINSQDKLWISHIAESAEELQAFSEMKGDLFFQITRRRPWSYGECTQGSMDYAKRAEVIPNGGICVHCNYVNGFELEYLVSKNVSVVICFSYTRFLGHKDFPLDVARNRGVNICLGTEGIAAAGLISLFDELFHLKNAYPHITAFEMLKWVTINPARALKMEDQLGSLTPGKFADMIAVKFAHDSTADLLEELLMEEPEVVMVMVDGDEVIVNY
jgi:cytosine/adenosine deaminase-related metal-dependent hydrolase